MATSTVCPVQEVCFKGSCFHSTWVVLVMALAGGWAYTHTSCFFISSCHRCYVIQLSELTSSCSNRYCILVHTLCNDPICQVFLIYLSQHKLPACGMLHNSCAMQLQVDLCMQAEPSYCCCKQRVNALACDCSQCSCMCGASGGRGVVRSFSLLMTASAVACHLQRDVCSNTCVNLMHMHEVTQSTDVNSMHMHQVPQSIDTPLHGCRLRPQSSYWPFLL